MTATDDLRRRGEFPAVELYEAERNGAFNNPMLYVRRATADAALEEVADKLVKAEARAKALEC